ncbi:MAG TPA: phage holin [Lactobacillus sp.]|uniref:phage holin n=1 Tax=Ligilactobacillus murinus TaxID=1622 RepID=UPI00096D92DF|nr:phage holin [Ligilactobacillus murinus]ASD50640.1 holin [Lactobacillus phage phiEF-1.1]HAP23560.1 phage holin [Lactobacillus sp.]
MNTNELVVTLLATVLTAVISYCGNVLVKNNRALTIVRALEPLAKDAVVAAQKLGVTEYLSGVAKKSHAVQTVAQALSNAGFTVKDEQVIKNAVEKAYAQQRDLLKQYPQKKED